MSRLRGLWHSIHSLTRRGTADRETAEEMAFHLERQTRKYVESGLKPSDAYARALRDFGGAQWRDATADARAGRLLDSLVPDIRHAFRSLARAPSFTLAAIATTAIGIGAATVAIGLLDGVLARRLPFAAPERIVTIYEANESVPDMPLSLPNFVDWKARVTTLDRMAAVFEQRVAIGVGDHPVIADAARVSDEFFEIFGVAPLRGRTIARGDGAAGAPPAGVISEGLWNTVFGADSSIVGRLMQIGLQRVVVVGVMPRRFEYPSGVTLWLSRTIDPTGPRNVISEQVVARLASGRTVNDARLELASIAQGLHRAYPDLKENQATSATVRPFRDDLIAPVRPFVAVLAGTLAVVLIIGCVNLTAANMARNLGRQRELALRAVLGAGRLRLGRHLLLESLLIAVAGAAAGIALAAVALALFPAIAPTTLPRLLEVTLDGRVAVYGALVSVLIGATGAMVPIVRIPLGYLGSTLGSPRATSTRESGRRVFIATEAAMAVVLLVAAGLSIRTTRALLRRDNGFDPRDLLTVETRLPPRGYGRPGVAARFYEQVLTRIRALPGVNYAAGTSAVPLAPAGMGFVSVEGRTPNRDAPEIAGYRLVTDDFFATMGMPILAGRAFDASDDSTTEHVTVINQSMARKFFPGENPIGRRFRAEGFDDHANVWLRVIGVVPDVRHWMLEAEMVPEHYVSVRQRPERAYNFSLMIRSALPTATLVPEVREALLNEDRGVATEFTTMDTRIATAIRDRRFTMIILTALAAVAMLLVVVGIYGVLSFFVGQRTREVGVRLALGADRSAVLAMVLTDSLRPVTVGAIVGLTIAFVISRALRSLTVDVSPADVVTYTGAIVVLLTAATAASYVPARRAASVDPMISLRAD